MTAAEYQTLPAEAEQETAEYQHLTETVKLSGAVFDYNAPLPPMPDYRAREWETQEEAQA